MNTWVKIAIAAGILLLGGVIYWFRLDSYPNDLAGQTAYKTYVMCRSCGQAYPATIGKEASFPLACSKCGKQEAWPQHQCYSCNYRFVPDPEGNPPHMPIAPRCPKCRSESVGGVLPDKK